MVGQPYRIPPRELRWLTARFINQVLCHPRDEEGRPITDDGAGGRGGGFDYRETFLKVWRERGASESQAEALWQAFIKHEAAKELELLRLGIIGMQGEIFDPKQHEDAELVWNESWRSTARRILGHA